VSEGMRAGRWTGMGDVGDPTPASRFSAKVACTHPRTHAPTLSPGADMAGCVDKIIVIAGGVVVVVVFVAVVVAVVAVAAGMHGGRSQPWYPSSRSLC
jgi:hypothetical protein